MHRGRSRERALFQSEVGVKVDVGGFNLLMTEPERDHGGIDTGVQQSHRCGMT